MNVLNKKEIQLLDEEWIELIRIAKTIGIRKEEIRTYFQETINKNKKAEN